MVKIRCEDCKKEKRIRHVIWFKGKYLCFSCRRKRPESKIQQSAAQVGRPMITLEEALAKTYFLKGYVDKDNTLHCILSLSSCLVGHKIKIILADEEVKDEQPQ